jgi:hypothetical protein
VTVRLTGRGNLPNPGLEAHAFGTSVLAFIHALPQLDLLSLFLIAA